MLFRSLSEITNKTGVNFSILQGVVTEIQNQFFGQLIIKLSTTPELIEQVLVELNKYDVDVEEIKGGLI